MNTTFLKTCTFYLVWKADVFGINAMRVENTSCRKFCTRLVLKRLKWFLFFGFMLHVVFNMNVNISLSSRLTKAVEMPSSFSLSLTYAGFLLLKLLHTKLPILHNFSMRQIISHLDAL